LAEVSIDGDLATLPPAAKGALAPHLEAIYISTVEEVPRSPAPDSPTDSVPENSAEYTGGIMPKDMSIAIRDAYQDAGITQSQAAVMLGLSRPHLANALAGRYALSEAKVESLRAFLAQPPPVVQPRLI
jgi:hypothetical protein